jgi:Na+/serine symporter
MTVLLVSAICFVFGIAYCVAMTFMILGYTRDSIQALSRCMKAVNDDVSLLFNRYIELAGEVRDARSDIIRLKYQSNETGEENKHA